MLLYFNPVGTVEVSSDEQILRTCNIEVRCDTRWIFCLTFDRGSLTQRLTCAGQTLCRRHTTS